ncbi:MAG TPA: BamA/TamA family outer membrane protein [Gammaproteobacteria bacterium]
MIKHYVITICLIAIMTPPVSAEEKQEATDVEDSSFSYHLIDRRKDQFSTSPGYAVFPYPYSLPGIGSGIGLVGGSMNISDTYTDAYAIVFGGEVKGTAVGMSDIHIIPRSLIFDVGYSDISKVQFMSYSGRGMETDENDFRLLDLSDTVYYGGRLTATFFDRRFELYGGWYKGASQLDSIRDKDGNIIVDAQDAAREWTTTTVIGTRLDLTDDYADPRRGFRLNISRFSTPPSDTGPDFYVMDYSMTAYVPIGKRSTWAFNVLRSDATVKQKGETDPANLQNQLGINCSDPTLTSQEQQYCIEVINNTIANNTYGTATSLGGFSYLRSYSQGRYSGAHTQFYGTEFRWNITDESTPFDIFIMKDIRTAFQLAAFFELGSTADTRSDLGNTWRESYGIGIRMVTASGVVFRADFAYGHEGFEPQMFIGYPWEL